MNTVLDGNAAVTSNIPCEAPFVWVIENIVFYLVFPILRLILYNIMAPRTVQATGMCGSAMFDFYKPVWRPSPEYWTLIRAQVEEVRLHTDALAQKGLFVQDKA
jgi:hypothetical protein